MQLEKRYWKDMLNADSADFLIGPLQYLNAENVRFGSTDFASGYTNYIESIGSFILKTNTNLPGTGTNITIGWAYDDPFKRFIFFNFNSLGSHGIYCYDATLDTVFTVLLNSQVTGGLNFDKDQLIHSARVENGNVYWSNSFQNEPRRLNIDAGINLNHPGTFPNVTAYTSPVTQSVIQWIRRQPALPPTSVKVTDGSFVNNFIALEAFQFSWRYIYRDYEISTLSGLSTLQDYNFDADTFNRINITLPLLEKIDQDVLQVDLVAKYLNSGISFVINSWNKKIPADAAAIAAHNAGTPLVYNFFNDRVGIALDAAYSAKPFDSVPIYAETIEMARNRSFMGNITAGYTSPLVTSLQATPNVQQASGTLTGKWVQIDFNFGASHHYFIDLGTLGFFDVSPQFVPPPFPATEDYVINLTFVASGPANFAVFIATSGSYPNWINGIQYPGNTATITNGPPVPGLEGSRVLKSDASYQVAINFFDNAGRKCGVVTNPALLIYVADRVFNQINYTVGANWSLSNINALVEIPLFAFSYSIDITRCLRTPFFLDMRGYNSTYVTKDASGNYVFTTSAYATNLNGCAFDITSLDTYQMGYVFTPGDILKFYPAAGGPSVSLKIIAQSGIWIITELHDLGTLDNAFNHRFLFEIYTPLQGSVTPPYFEVGSQYLINNPATNTRAYSVLAGTLNGDVFLLKRHDTPAALDYLVEAMSSNDKFYKIWNTDAGRPDFVDMIGQVTKPDTIAWSNTFIPSTQVNGLSTYDALDQKDISPDYGPVRKLQLTSKVQRTGSIMLAICSGGETASLYLSENTIMSNTGDTVIAQSNNIIGTINQLKGAFGTLNPESVIEFRGNVYWYDADSGKIIQYADNGLFPISNYDMTKYWKLFSDTYNSLTQGQIEALGNRPFVFAGIDPHNGELLFAVPKVLATPPLGYLPDYPFVVYPFDIWDGQGKTLVYKLYADPNKWQGSYQFNPEYFAYIENKLYSFKNGNLYQHNDPNSFNNFYGVQQKSRIMFVSNQLPTKPKVYNNIAVEANLIPSFSYFMSIYPYVQSSDLIDSDYETKEGIFYAAIYRDKLSPQFLHNFPVALISGDKMRTTALRIMLEFSAVTTPVQLKFATIGYSVSEGHTV